MPPARVSYDGGAIDEMDPAPMADARGTVATATIDRLATAYAMKDATGELVVDDFSHGTFRGEITFEAGGGGLVSTADDFLAFATAMRNGGLHEGVQVLSPGAAAAMTTDQLSAAQKQVSGFWPGYFDEMGWGFGVSVRTVDAPGGPSVGTYGWPGYFGTAWYNDPAADLTTIVMWQNWQGGDQRLPMWQDLWAAVYGALDRS